MGTLKATRKTRKSLVPVPKGVKPNKNMRYTAKWDDTFYVTIYENVRIGMTDAEVAKMCGVSAITFSHWKLNKPAVRDAYDRGKASMPDKPANDHFKDYVYQRLSPELAETWRSICELKKDRYAGSEKEVEKLNDEDRQKLYVHAYINLNFVQSKALKASSTTYRTLKRWERTVPNFRELMVELIWHKNNFFEDALMKKVAAGDTAVILHCARTKLAERGYGDKLQVDVNNDTNITINQNNMNVLDLKLSVECRRELLAAMRKATPDKDTVDQEVQRLEHDPSKIIEVPAK